MNNKMSQLTLEEKLTLGIGNSFWKSESIKGIDAITMSDGPHGLRVQGASNDMIGINESLPATCFPAAVTSGASWNEDLLKQVGKAIGLEAQYYGVGVVLGPGCNIKRNPLCGRNFEYFSEDPYIAGKLASSYIQGQQSTGVASSLKHFAVNNQETKRFNSNSIIDERALREIYLSAFERAIKEAHPKTVMCSYNKINGVFSSDNKTLLTDILRKEWGFNGLVVTDWGAMHDRILSYQAGCDLCMPGPSKYMEKAVKEAVKQGKLLEEDIDRSVSRVIELSEYLSKTKDQQPFDQEKHHLLAKQVALQGAVLLKNEDHILPVNQNDLVIVGYMAKNFRYQGAGSSHIVPTKLSSLTEVLSNVPYIPCGNELGEVSQEELETIQEEVTKAKVAVVVAGLPDGYESEGFDRENMKMPQGHMDMIETVAKANPNTVVVLLGGSCMEIPWEKNVKGILYMGLSGQAGAEACADLLTGKANPSGKLTESWPISYEDVVSKDIFGTYDAEYIESIYVGYRYYDKAKVKVRYPFGYGLSYSNFEYSNIKVNDHQVSCTITNTSEVAGKEVVQLYIGMPQDGIFRPIKELKGFKCVDLEAHTSKEVTFILEDRSFALWDDEWKIPKGEYSILIGSSSQDIHLTSTIQVEGEVIDEYSPESYSHLQGLPSREDWEVLMKHKVSPFKMPKKGEFTLDNSCLEMKDSSIVMKIQYKVTESIVAKSFGGKKDYNNPAFKMMMICATDCPLHSVVINSSGAMSDSLAKGMLEMANGHYLKGIYRMIKG